MAASAAACCTPPLAAAASSPPAASAEATGTGPDETEEPAECRIQVVVRVRPVLPHESFGDVAVTCAPDGSRVQVLLPERDCCKPTTPSSPAAAANRGDSGSGGGTMQRGGAIGGGRPDARSYEFDACLPGSATQEQMFDLCGIQELVEASLDGYRATVFAFGQTGSGKTHTIVGPRLGRLSGGGSESGAVRQPRSEWQRGEAAGIGSLGMLMANGASSANRCKRGPLGLAEPIGLPAEAPHSSEATGAAGGLTLDPDDGLLPRCIEALFSGAAARAAAADFAIEVSCCELYNEAVTDLLAGDRQRQLQVRQDPTTGAFYVAGLSSLRVRTAQAALSAVSSALAYRQTRAHRLNAYSSRSHCLVAFSVASEDRTAGGAGGRGVRRAGRLTLVDLAGSERLAASGNTADRAAVQETGHINRSLFALGQVLGALSERGRRGAPRHVPFRDDKLTQLLWDSLRGTGRALMVACLAPLRAHAAESHNTLHFAGMALRISGEPVVTIDPQDQAVLDLRATVRALRKDVTSLAQALHAVSQPGADVLAVLRDLPPTLVQDALRLGVAGSAPAGDASMVANQRLRLSGGGAGGKGKRGSQQASRRKAPEGALPFVATGGLLDTASERGPSPPPWDTSTGPGSPSALASSGKGTRARAQSWSLGGSGFSGGLARGGTMGSPFTSSPGSPSSRSVRAGSPLRPRQQPKWVGASAYAPILGIPPPKLQSLWPSNGGPHSPSSRPTGPSPGGLRSSGGGGSGSPSPLRQRGGSPWPTNAAWAAGGSGRGSVSPGGVRGCWTANVEDLPLSSFPELAAMEAAFQSGTLPPVQSPQHSHAATAPITAAGLPGRLGALPPVFSRLPPGVAARVPLPASVDKPRSLLPVRTSVTDPTVGQMGLSAVEVAAAAAAAGVRPMPLSLSGSAPHNTHSSQQRQQQAQQPHQGGRRQQQHRQQQQPGTQLATATGEKPPDAEALQWAARNSWFGTDPQMTATAVAAHDQLVDAGADPSSAAYFAAIEAAVAAAHPEQWAAARDSAAPGADTAGGQAAHAHQEQPQQLQQQQRTLPLQGAMNPQQHPSWPGLRTPAAAGHAGLMTWEEALAAFARQHQHPSGYTQQSSNGWGGGSDPAGAFRSAADAHREFAASRLVILDGLRRAKEDAERQRRAILLQFGRAVGRQQWV